MSAYLSEMKCIIQAEKNLVFFAHIKWGSVRKEIAFCGCGAAILSLKLRPGDTELWIVPGQSAFIAGMIKIRTFISKFRNIRQNKKTVSKALRNIKLFFVLAGKNRAVPFSKSIAAAS